jgi:hypothetical protein
MEFPKTIHTLIASYVPWLDLTGDPIADGCPRRMTLPDPDSLCPFNQGFYDLQLQTFANSTIFPGLSILATLECHQDVPLWHVTEGIEGAKLLQNPSVRPVLLTYFPLSSRLSSHPPISSLLILFIVLTFGTSINWG